MQPTLRIQIVLLSVENMLSCFRGHLEMLLLVLIFM